MILAMAKVGKSDYAIELADYVAGALERLQDPGKAVEMAAYMKTDMPFYGVQKPGRMPIIKHVKERFRPVDSRQYAEGVLALWERSHREEKYLAINYALSFRQFVSVESFGLYERLIREGAWWDFVDGVAADLIGGAYLNDRPEVKPIINKWSKDADKWIRRTTLICQLHHKDKTDHEQLFSLCLLMSGEKEFFIQKAIGWALREYSKTNAGAVKKFLRRNKDNLSPLSYRQAGRLLLNIKAPE